MIHIRNKTYRGGALIALAMLVFSIGNIMLTLLSSMPITQILFMRALFGVPLLLAYFICVQKHNPFKTHTLRLQVMQGIIGHVNLYLLFYSFILLPFAEATTLTFSCVIFVALLSVPILKQKISKENWLAILVGFIGVLICSKPAGINLSHLGIVTAIMAAFTESILVIMARPLGETDGPLTVSFYQMFLSLLISLPIYFSQDWIWPTTPHVFLMLLCLSLVGIIGCLCLVHAYTIAKAATISPLLYTMIIWGGIFGYFIWGEIPVYSGYIGAMFIAISGVYIMRHENKLPRS